MCTYNADQNVPRSFFFFVVFFSLALSLFFLVSVCLLRARAQRNTRRSRGLSPRERRAAARELNSGRLGNMVVVITTNSNSGKRRRPLAEKAKRLHTFPTSARKKGEKHIHESSVRGGGRPKWRQEYHEMQGKGNRLLSSEQAESPPVRVRHLG